jgi:dienelactone hydrolase
LLRLEPTADKTVLVGDLASGPETVHFHLYPAPRKDAPLVLLVPILGGGEELLRTMARRFVDRGYHALYCDRAGSALRPPQRGPELETLLVRTVLHQRIALAWASDCDRIHPVQKFACGVSMGGIVTTLLTAVEPGLSGSAMCLAGADLPTILGNSAEARIEKWRDWRRSADGVSDDGLQRELRQCLRSDPLRFAPCVPTDRVFLVAADFDDVVRPEHQDLLWEALGRPQRLSVPLGHYTAALCLDPLISSIADFFDGKRRLPAASVASVASH